MGLLKALLRYLFRGDDETKENRKHPPSMPMNEHKEIEAKVVYEYPKRFVAMVVFVHMCFPLVHLKLMESETFLSDKIGRAHV